jgi:hypothetical protein
VTKTKDSKVIDKSHQKEGSIPEKKNHFEHQINGKKSGIMLFEFAKKIIGSLKINFCNKIKPNSYKNVPND